ncbi:hypothetical protein DM02DRAFT_651301 [Periconia macrospinosa]|uniref:F-box domain-containing protein n=1 Tax=Periconia macrospinosa TaxID=97972 RepID=A0A2V1E3G6_9PLEO|nr:hypothetical protein DM02DRAFT_651301 [Periconia macrospinosa]
MPPSISTSFPQSYRSSGDVSAIFNRYQLGPERTSNIMLLAQLPSELIREILYRLDPASFYTCLQTVKLFRQHAFASKALVHAHLKRIPGHRILQEEAEHSADSAFALFTLFCQRANEHLFNLAEKMADVSTWQPEQPMHTRISGLLCWKGLSEMTMKMRGGISKKDMQAVNAHILAYSEVQPERGIVTLYTIQDYGVHGHRPRIQYIISPSTISTHLEFFDMDGNPQYKIMKVVTYKAGLAVLYAPLDSINSPEYNGVVWKLLLFHLRGGHVVSCYNVIDVQQYGSTFMDLVIDSEFNAVIDWRRVRAASYGEPDLKIKITKYIIGGGYWYTNLNVNSYQDKGLNFKMSVRGRNVDLIQAAGHMPHWTATSIGSDRYSQFARQTSCFAPDRHQPAFGHTLAKHHTCGDPDPNGKFLGCVNTALKLLISRFYSGERHDGKQGAFLVKALQFPDTCEEYDWDGDMFRHQHVVVARLAGLPNIYNLSTLGLVIAMSPASDRIAIASWKTLLVYSVDPDAFLNPDYDNSRDHDLVFRMNRGAYELEDHIEHCGWNFYSSAAVEENYVVLNPIQLECKGVVYELEWQNKNELWGWGEEGLVRWNIGATAKGRRGRSSLGEDWLETAQWMCSQQEDA